MSLLRNVFWLGLIMLGLALSPDFGVLGPAADRGRERAGFEDLFYVISATISDLGEICDRRPEVCEKLDRIGDQVYNRAVRITGAAHDWLIGSDDESRAPVHAEAPDRDETEPASNHARRDALRVAETPHERGE